MRLVRFSTPEMPGIRTGIVEKGTIHEVDGHPLDLGRPTGRVVDSEVAQLHAPLEPKHVIGIGNNFVDLGEDVPIAPQIPVLFFKPTTTIIGPVSPIVLPRTVTEVRFEAELAVVIGKPGRDVTPDSALEHVLGYTVANDIAAPQYHHPDGHWTVSKSFDTFCPIGPAIVTDLDLPSIVIEGYVNGVRKQSARLDRMITGVAEMISYVSSFMTISQGDVLLTGTPAGAGVVRNGDVVECVIEPIGCLTNRVVEGLGTSSFLPEQ